MSEADFYFFGVAWLSYSDSRRDCSVSGKLQRSQTLPISEHDADKDFGTCITKRLDEDMVDCHHYALEQAAVHDFGIGDPVWSGLIPLERQPTPVDRFIPDILDPDRPVIIVFQNQWDREVYLTARGRVSRVGPLAGWGFGPLPFEAAGSVLAHRELRIGGATSRLPALLAQVYVNASDGRSDAACTD